MKVFRQGIGRLSLKKFSPKVSLLRGMRSLSPRMVHTLGCTTMDPCSTVAQFLTPLALEEHIDKFIDNGYDRETDFLTLDEKDLDILRITDAEQRSKLMDAVSHFKHSDDYRMLEWLREHGLEDYFRAFRHSKYSDLGSIKQMVLSDVLFDELNMKLHGHRKRLELAVGKLRKRRRVAERTIAVGYWGRPRELVGATHDFLCVKAIVKSTKPDKPAFHLEFMVDSGSDVVTLSPAILQQLDLDLLGTIESRGVHATVQKQLYKGKLVIGSQEIVAEIMPEQYNSVGSRVMRHFKHYITGDGHMWLDAKMDHNQQS